MNNKKHKNNNTDVKLFFLNKKIKLQKSNRGIPIKIPNESHQ